MDLGRAVVALREQRHPLAIGCVANFARRRRGSARRLRHEHCALRKTHRVRVAAEHPRRPLRVAAPCSCVQASTTAAPFKSVPAEAAVADVLGTLSVRVGITRIALQQHAQALRRDLPDLGVQPLAHLRAAVIHLHAAVAINQHQRARLIEERRGEGNAELHRRDGESALASADVAR